jgi:hypothetical protein
MALALLGYFGTMITALVVLMTLLNGVLSSYPMQKTRPQPYPLPQVAQPVQAANSDASSQSRRWQPPIVDRAADDRRSTATIGAGAQPAAANPTAAGKGYDQERSRTTLGPLALNPFNLFEPGRF